MEQEDILRLARQLLPSALIGLQPGEEIVLKATCTGEGDGKIKTEIKMTGPKWLEEIAECLNIGR